jgi:hypothetical protein
VEALLGAAPDVGEGHAAAGPLICTGPAREGDGLGRLVDIETRGEIYNVFTIEGHTIMRIEDYLERDAALAAAGIT